ncbi:hypothetical protein [Desulfotomaculum nigrificans]|nr:hypothetical protein [Desulfotomaculum nigrificans]
MAVTKLLASGISINDKPDEKPKKEEPLIEKPKPAVKNPKALADF